MSRASGGGRRHLAVAVCLVVLVATVLPALLLTAKVSPALANTAATTAPTPPGVPGPDQAYLGGFVDPDGQALSTTNPTGGALSLPAELTDLSDFNQGLARPLSIVELYQTWTRPVLQTQLDRVLASGAIPMITWLCGDTDAHVAVGVDDSLISHFAASLAAAGTPVLLRWFPDPNDTVDNLNCLGKAGASGYVDAFRHIHDLFVAAGASNVSFVWSVDTTAGGTDWRDYFPGNRATDWIAADARYAATTAPGEPALASEFAGWYSDFSSSGKPLMISDAAAPAAAQTAYFRVLLKLLSTQLRDVKAFVYFDAPDKSAVPRVRFSLGLSGLRAFQALSQDARFLPGRATTEVTIASESNVASLGQVVKLTATVKGDADLGGNISFLDDGSVIAGCGQVPVKLASSCDTSSLGSGDHRLSAVYNGDAQGAAATSRPYDLTVSRAVAGLGLPSIPPPGHAYLGAWVKPVPLQQEPKGTTPIKEELQTLPTLDARLGRPLSVVHVYQNWSQVTPTYQLRALMADGAIPMIDWLCGDSNANIVAGKDDTLIRSLASELAALKGPLFLRWYFEPNFPGSPNFTSCIGSGGPAGYVQAFQHIHNVFAAAGATNVAFVWTVATSGSDQDFIDYYPGSAYVDWIAADGYDRSIEPDLASPGTFARRFTDWYSDFASFGKPMMVTETAAIAGASQAQYLQEIGSDLAAGQFPLLKGLLYFDAAAHSAAFDYPLSASGLDAFEQLSRSPLFLPPRRATTVIAVVASPRNPLVGQEVRLTASLSSTDLGGSLTFYVNHGSAPVVGCSQLAISLNTSCNTDQLITGLNTVVAIYSGDAQFAPSRSTPAPVAVTAQPTSSHPSAPRVPGANQAYLGAWINPTGANNQPTAEIQALPSFNAGLGRPLSIVHVYQSWARPTLNSELRTILADGAIPMIDWRCGDSDARIIAGDDDTLIARFANRLAALKAPVFLRWYYEPNFPQASATATCLGAAGPQGYQLAFQHIHDLFRAAGATNVAFVWSIGVSGTTQDLSSYYPGSAYVDWIAADGYLRSATPTPNSVVNLFGGWYSQFSMFGKPMMISETAAFAGGQAQFLQQLAAELPTQFPLVKAVIYFDGPGQAGHEPYPLDRDGLQELQKLSRSAYFQPTRMATTTVVAASADLAGPTLHLAANVPANDSGGTVAFLVDNKPVAGCQPASLTATPSCVVSDLPSGYYSTGAAYSGDAEYAASIAAPVTVLVTVPHATSLAGMAPSFSIRLGPEPQFSGVPGLAAVPPLKFPAEIGARLPSFQLPVATASPHPSKTANSYPVLPAVAGSGRPGYGLIAVLVGLALVFCFGAYITTTWIVDRRRHPTERSRP
jgi:beta-mannanase